MTVGRAILPLGLAVVAATCGSALAGQPASATRAASLVSSPESVAEGYERRGRRDPFVPPQGGPQGDLTVASARLKGIIRGSVPRALIETPDGVGYIMRAGDALGEGRLIEIGARSVVFSVPPGRGSSTDRIILRLPPD